MTITIDFNVVINIIIIAVLLALFVVFVRLAQLLSNVTITVKKSHTTMDHVDTLLVGANETLETVEPLIQDAHDKYFKVSDSIASATSSISGFVSRFASKGKE